MATINHRRALSIFILACIFSSGVNISRGATHVAISDSDHECHSDDHIGEIVHECVMEPGLRGVASATRQFMRKNSKLNPGIAAMRNMYDARNVDAFRSELSQSSFVRNVVHIARLLTIASCSVVKYISAEYPTVTMYGNMLIGLYVGKALLWGLGTYVEYNSGKPVLDIVNALRGDEGDRISMATMNACIYDIREDVVASIARAVTSLIRSGDRVEIAREDFDKISRLDTLIQKLDSGRSIGKWGLCAARSASLLAGVTAGVVTSFQDLGPSAFWMKLSSNAMDAITDSVDMFRAGEVVDKYVTISEIMYLCEYFLSQETYEL